MAKNAKNNAAMAQGLESANAQVVNSMAPNYGNREWLAETIPFFPAEDTSAKYNADREPKVQAGLETIKKFAPNFPSTMLLLAAWWENKTARAEIKKMLDAEALSKGEDPVAYLQDTMRKAVNEFDGLMEAVDRLNYAITYFKPRGGMKETFKLANINGKVYNVSLRVLAEIKAKHEAENGVEAKLFDAKQKKAFYDEIASLSQEMVADEL